MKKKLFILIAAAVLILFAVNRDLFRYSFSFTAGRTFSPEENAKGDYYLTEAIPLKPGNYKLSFRGMADANGSAVLLCEDDAEPIVMMELFAGQSETSMDFFLTDRVYPLHLGIGYDPQGSLSVRKIEITSDNVLYKDSLLRHLTLSVFVLLSLTYFGYRWLKAEKLRIDIDAAFLLLLTAAVCFPYFSSKTYVHGEDLFFHLSRIEGIAESLKAGYFPVRDQLFWLKNYGYGTGYFYPDLLLYFPAVLRLLGFSLLAVWKIFVISCTFGTLLSFYWTARQISGNRTAGRIAAFAVAFSTYRLTALYYRAGLGEVQAFCFAPLIVLGLYDIFHGKPQRWPVFALGFFGVLSSHVISLVMAAMVTAAYVLCNIRKVIQDKKILFALLKSAVIVCCLDAFFLLPMWEQTQAGGLVINTLLSAFGGGVAKRALSPWRNLFLFFHDWSYGTDYTRCIYPGWPLLFTLLVCPLVSLKRKQRMPLLGFAPIASLVLLWISTDLFPWQLTQWLLNRIQFSWRLLLPVTVLLSLTSAIVFADLWSDKHGKFLTCVFCGLCIACGGRVIWETIEHRTVDKDLFIMQDNRVCGREYLPNRLNIEFVDKNGDTVTIVSGAGEVTFRKRRGLEFLFSWEGAKESETVFDLPLIKYVGFRAELIHSDGSKTPIPIARGEHGLIQVTNQNLPSGTIRAYYAKTPVMRIGEVISLLTLLCIIALYKKKRVNK